MPTVAASLARAERERALAEKRGDDAAVHMYAMAIMALRGLERDPEGEAAPEVPEPRVRST